jgi:DNA processing protein
MTLRTAVAASLLPASRTRIASAFKARREHPDEGILSSIAATLGLDGTAIDTASRRADRLLSATPTGIEAVPWFDRRYPPLLDCVPDPPPVIWVRGTILALSRPSVAIVGSRAATEYAKQVAAGLAADLTRRGISVVSGLARGVDSAAHRGALEAGGPTVAVLGNGPDRIYPAEHRDLAASICEHGALVSELGPGAPPLPEHFPLRNRIISGISLAVVVVEACDGSGSLITARCALDQGRDVMAVPGSVLSGRNQGSHRLLKDGAKVVESADDILEGLGWPSGAPAGSRARQDEDADPLLGRMAPGEAYRLDELMALTGASGPKLLPRLMELELQGRVASSPAGTFRRTPDMKSDRQVC